MKTLSRILLLITLTAMILTGCNKEDKADETKQPDSASGNEEADRTVITFGMMASSDVIPFVLINDMGLADKYNITLELEVFTSAKDRDAAFQAGELDGVITDFIGICMYQNADFDVRITGITDGDYILVAGKDTGITHISQIKGRSIAISENTLIDYTLDNILENNNMASDDLKKELVPRIPDRLELLRNDQIDLGLMPEPFATLALKDGAVRLGSANEFGLYPAVSAFSMKALQEKEDAIRNLYIAYNEAVDYMNQTDIRDYEETVIEAVGYPEEMTGKVEVGTFRTSALPSEEEIEKAVAWAGKKGLCSESLTYDQLVYDINTK